jgi:hypothetical protein
MILQKWKLRFNIPSMAINSIMILALVLPTIRAITEVNVHRIPYVLVIIYAFFTVIYRGYIYKDYILTNILLFGVTIIGVIINGTLYSAVLTPIIFGLLFYIIMGKTYSYNFYNLYKLLIITILVEFLIINIIDYQTFSFLSSDVIHSYRILTTKFGGLIGIDIYLPNSLFYGVQVTSMILAVSFIMFQRHKIWRILTIMLFCICFSLTSIIMLIVGLFFLNKKAMFPVIIFFLFILFYIFYSKSIDFQHYYSTFSAFPIYWWDRSIMDKLFGFPNSPINVWSHEFGYFFIIKHLGLLNVLMLIIMNLFLLLKRPNIHSIIVTMLHVSLIHYNPALGLGIAQLFGLHIAYAMRHDGTDVLKSGLKIYMNYR